MTDICFVSIKINIFVAIPIYHESIKFSGIPNVAKFEYDLVLETPWASNINMDQFNTLIPDQTTAIPNLKCSQ